MTQQSFLQRLTHLLEEPSISDVHLNPELPIWVRSGGEMSMVNDDVMSTLDLDTWLSVRYKDNSVHSSLIALGGQDDFALNLGNMRIRVHAWLSQGQINVSVRRLASTIPPLAGLGLPASVNQMIQASQGLVLVTGPTGSGKSTTLASMIDWLNDQTASHIITLEDPIEYVHHDKRSRVRQRQIGESNDCASFARGVVSTMREDPDILMVGEMRDVATVQAAMNAAQTGHLVFGTLHTNSAQETIDRILSFFQESDRELARSVLAAVLRGVVSQRLIRNRQGTRTLVAEILVATRAVRVHIGAGITNLITQEMRGGASSGQLPLNSLLSKLVREGILDRETALTASNDRTELENELGLATS